MNTKLIKKHNPQSFLDDLKRVREVMVYAECTNSYYQILKAGIFICFIRISIYQFVLYAVFQIPLSVRQ